MVWHCVELAVSQAFRVWPVVVIGFSQDARDLLKLVHLGRPGKQGLECVELCHYAPKCEHVNWIIIRAAAQDILRRAVPPGGNILREWRRVPDLLD